MDNSLKITALQPEVLVKLLKQAGSRTASPEMIAEDLGCVVNRFVLYYANVKKGYRENGECIRTT